MRVYNNYNCNCPKCTALIDANNYFDNYTVFGDYYAGNFKVCCEICNYEFTVERCILVTYRIDNENQKTDARHTSYAD
jgi:hypothetical protein